MRPEPFYTFGVRGQLRTVKASLAQGLPPRMVQIFDELGDTWGYKLFGTRTIITRDPRNIQAVLATQFDGTFERMWCGAGALNCCRFQVGDGSRRNASAFGHKGDLHAGWSGLEGQPCSAPPQL